MKFAHFIFQIQHFFGYFLIILILCLCTRHETKHLSRQLLSVTNISETEISISMTSNETQNSECRINKSGPSGYITKEDIPQNLINSLIDQMKPLDCVWNITVEHGYKIKLNFMDLTLQCDDGNYIYLDEDRQTGNGGNATIRLPLCSKRVVAPLKSLDNHMSIRLTIKWHEIDDVRFHLAFNSYRVLSNNDKYCTYDEFDCGDSTCVSAYLRCDGVDNCDNGLDEDKDSTCLPVHPPLLIQLFYSIDTNVRLISAFVFGMLVAFLTVCCCKKVCCTKQNKTQVSAHL